jgi:hypothetical protein
LGRHGQRHAAGVGLCARPGHGAGALRHGAGRLADGIVDAAVLAHRQARRLAR